MKQCFEHMRLADKTMDIIIMVSQIVEEYSRLDIKMNIRQIYYQFIARDWFPDDWIDEKYNLKHGLAPDTKNTQKNYKRLGGIISKGRMAGHIDWDQIVDLVRSLHSQIAYPTPRRFMDIMLPLYQKDMWKSQGKRIEIWIEKEALTGVIAGVCSKLRVPYFACKGCPSQSSVYEASKRILDVYEKDEEHVILYLGDHDPTGLNIDRDIETRLMKMTRYDIVMHRIALTMDQIKEFRPPPNPAKTTDPSYKSYVKEHGESCWELDALDPMYMADMLHDEIWEYVDPDLWDADLEQEQEDKKWLRSK